jgi:hypothetical protein
MVDSQQAIGCFLENGIDPTWKHTKNKYLNWYLKKKNILGNAESNDHVYCYFQHATHTNLRKKHVCFIIQPKF